MRTDVDWIFGREGPFAEKFAGYESRPGQIAYAKAVEACLGERNADRRPLLIEGPTGTGKTLGYLIPAIASIKTRPFRVAEPGEEAATRRRKVLVATSNIALQEQIVGKDLPFIKDVTGWPFSWVLLKGRSNYACHRAHEDLTSATKDTLFGELDSEIQRLKEWFRSSKTGDKSEIDPSPAPTAWAMMTSTSEECTVKKCPHFDSCYYYGQRRRANEADVIVTNYSFLLTEVALRLELGAPAVLLPEFDIVVCDEAHDLGEIARRFFAQEIRAQQFTTLGRLLGGPRLALTDEASRARELGRDWNDLGASMIRENGESGVLFDPAKHLEARAKFESALKDIKESVERKARKFRDKIPGMAGYPLEDVPEPHRKAIDAMLRPATICGKLLDTLPAILPKPEDVQETHVYYVETEHSMQQVGGERRVNHTLVSCPFSSGELLKAALWDQCENVVLTSATLATRLRGDGTRFAFVRTDLGLLTAPCYEEIVESPFDFNRNMGVYIDRTLDPTLAERQKVAERIIELLTASRGRALVLFTSYRALDEIHGMVAGRVPFRCFKQGESSRLTLTNKFRDDVSSCLFATRSFFQGIDVQGESLSLLILDKIPFPAVGDPFIETAKRKGERDGNKWGWFNEHSIPRALMSFRQAIGRLIRTQSDTGVVAVLDARIASGGKSYGKQFRDSIPSQQYLDGVSAVADFFTARGVPPPPPPKRETVPTVEEDFLDDIPF